MRILITVIAVLAILVTATITNPTSEEFINWGIAEIRGQSDSDIERILGGTVSEPVDEVDTEMSDYVFFTVFTIQENEAEYRYLGVFNTFFNLN
ncbi:hypothetical protein C8C77_11220 [Halanaerobium saccharolyticum]|uniref:DUF4359 domain-containing protein n=1 Tax=Halanaerobium saccharolyticum TaxID=43595 RepID=A0A4R7Z0A1_9FIRM|nr:hypothetical protein [Halanaerobium saccharolyticum]RAK08479.1 hypothetical protein C7958_11056 [Halanaerobium saccharolyticum]TDW03486.1 hypothetical protein C8C77_11220 [Halanaerobium saccharolyticum]TDX59971.1 hypothetical protein C7956_11156 [Halanaerobium saccharolyticum]